MPKRQAKKRKVAEELPDAASSDSEAHVNSEDERVYDASERWHREQDRLIQRDQSDGESVASGEERLPFPQHEEVFQLSDAEEEDEEEEYEDLKDAHDRFMRRHRDELKRKDVRREMGDSESESDAGDKRRSFAKKSEMGKAGSWGKRRDAYYEADFDKRKDAFRFRTRDDQGSGSDLDDQEDLDEAQLEEREARAIQKRLAEPMDAQADMLVGLGLSSDAPARDADSGSAHVDAGPLEAVSVDLDGLSLDEQLRLLKRESPELAPLIKEAHRVLGDLRTNWWPLLHATDVCGKQPSVSPFGVQYIRTKCELLLSYVTNLTFFLMLKAKRASNVQAHPVIARVVELRTLLKQSDALDGLHASTLDQLQQCVRAGRTAALQSLAAETVAEPRKKKRVGVRAANKRPDKVAKNGDALSGKTASRDRNKTVTSPDKHVRFADEEKTKKNARTPTMLTKQPTLTAEVQAARHTQLNKEGDQDEALNDPQAKHKISREMETNRGLTPKRAKHYRNPRVRHRVQFRKANIRRRGQVQQVRAEHAPYGGEFSGINMAVRKSTRLA